jgi:hypothetical protein
MMKYACVVWFVSDVKHAMERDLKCGSYIAIIRHLCNLFIINGEFSSAGEIPSGNEHRCREKGKGK